MMIVKLGGSMMRGEHLAAWMNTLDTLSGPVVVVPGGGSFADAVRDIQRADDFDGRLSDTLAHNMAVLGMAQYAWLLHAFHDEFVLQDDWHELRVEIERGGKRQIWLPSPDRLPPGIVPDWGSTSDSIAAALAVATRSSQLLLVKSAPVGDGPQPLSQLAANGIVDRAFSGWFARLEQPAYVVSASDFERRERLGGGIAAAASLIVP
ncbi:MAG: hypothetical protein HKO62_05930 [Gammaproteobacteria bacterium]|nr:hypothetical protein [Gammaproteobacteria bacterium]NNM00269.1 hypothetical protein [Gammaproteobacteria bacterium]